MTVEVDMGLRGEGSRPELPRIVHKSMSAGILTRSYVLPSASETRRRRVRWWERKTLGNEIEAQMKGDSS